MALLPTKTGKRRLVSANQPNYADFSSPPNGDYVRYVEGLMAWAQQQQERQRLQSLGQKAVAKQGSEPWGRTQPPVSSATTKPAPKTGASSDQMPSQLQRLQLAVQAQLAKLHPLVDASAKGQTQLPPRKPQVAGLGVVALFAGFVLASIFAPGLLPVVIIGWVVFYVIRAVRAASASSQP